MSAGLGGGLGSILVPIATTLIGATIGAPKQPKAPAPPLGELGPSPGEVEAEEASRLRALKRRRAGSQGLLELEQPNTLGKTLLGE